MSSLSPRNSTSQPTPSPATQLVKALMAYGSQAEAAEGTPKTASTSELDNEEEDVRVSGDAAQILPSERVKGKGKAKNLSDSVSESLDELSLNDSPTAKPKPKPPKSIHNLMKSSQFHVTIPGETDSDPPVERILTSWKMADYAYKREPCPFPTRARGLFTEKVSGSQDEFRIVARGYDKFFNIGEVSWTQWETIPKHSKPPYEVTQKSNGCIILISALTERDILVTSKHAIGAQQKSTTEVSHSQRGEFWLEKHLEKVGKTEKDLAKELYDKELTAVAELCDDSFEEHVLAYRAELTGLHLHGLNHNTPTLNTLPSAKVTEFAREWGFIPTPFLTFPSVLAVKTYCENVDAVGGIENDDGTVTPVEGFVVRGQKRVGDLGEAFFWKVKYDFPYLMYREWRELTRKLLAAYPNLSGVNPNKLKNEQSRLYLWWIKREMEKDVEQFASWKSGKGIIKTREFFLAWSKSEDARQARIELGQSTAQDYNQSKIPFDRTLIVPIAVQGCGKTALGLGLKNLFGWAHIQSDDFAMKKSRPHFIKAVKEALQENQVVFADKNNHQIMLREDLVDCAVKLFPRHRTRLVALVYPIDSETLPRDKLHALCAKRIVERGARHQTLRAGEFHEAAIWLFLGQHEKFDAALNKADGEFHHVIEVKPEWQQTEALRNVITELKQFLPEIESPDQTRLQSAVEAARNYEPQVKKADNDSQLLKRLRDKPIRYFGVSLEIDLKQFLLEKVWPDENSRPELVSELIRGDRIEKHGHVTLVHQLECQSEDAEFAARKQKVWDRYSELVQSAEQGGDSETLRVKISLGPVIAWDSRVMAVQVSAVESETQSIQLEFDHVAHVTLGTISSDVRPVEGKFLLEAALSGKNETKQGGKIHQQQFQILESSGKLAGLK